jgi:hypothetical protein
MKTETNTTTQNPFFAKAIAMGGVTVKTRIKAGRKQEQDDK